MEPDEPIALFITYTMLNPIVGGAFFRALRLACELHRRGWSPVIYNYGPILNDPKVDQARDFVRFESLHPDAPGYNSMVACEQFRSVNPTVIIMGEGPFQAMEVFYDGAKMAGRPFVVLDQYYNHWLQPKTEGVDLVLLYGLKSFWKEDIRLTPPMQLVPPFIEKVTPRAELPVPSRLDPYPWLVLIAYESNVLRVGCALLEGLEDVEVAVIAVSPDPEEAAKLLEDAHIPPERTTTLPLLEDAHVFGLMGAARVTLVSNGFLQIMEALAMGSPVIALKRGSGIGMGPLNIDERFVPFVSFGEEPDRQKERLEGWLAASPFSPALRDAVKSERGGTVQCANLIEGIVQRRLMAPARNP